MSVSLTVNGVAYDFPQSGDTGWAQAVTDWATAVSTTTLQRTGGAFTLTAEVDWGASHATKGIYWKSRTANPAAAGQIRLARADTVRWRNAANSADLELGVDASDRLTYGGALVQSTAGALTASRAVVTDGSGTLVSATTTAAEIGHVNGVTSAIQTQLNAKLNLSGGVMTGNLDLDGQDLIVDSAGTMIIDDNGGTLRVRVAGNEVASFANTAGLQQFSFTDDGAGVGPILRLRRVSATPAASDQAGTIDFASSNSAAAIPVYSRVVGVVEDPTSGSEDARLSIQTRVAGALTEVAQLNGVGVNLPIQTASRALATDGSKNIVSTAVTATELGYLSGVTSALQTQINAISGLELLATYTPSAAASVDITSIISSTYDAYFIESDLLPATDSNTLLLRTDTNNGASFDSGASDYSHQRISQTGSTVTGSGSDAANSISLGGAAIGNATNEGISSFIVLQRLGSATRWPLLTYHSALLDTSSNLINVVGSGTRRATGPIDAVQLIFNSGNIASGTVRIYGLPKT